MAEAEDKVATRAQVRGKRRFALGRHHGLSDGVFSIAMTLLVLDIKLPDVPSDFKMTEAYLFNFLTADSLSHFATFILSFYVIGSQWLAHHEMFDSIEYTDRRLLLFNLQYLMVIAVMPFPSALLANYGSESIAVAVYAVAIGLGGLLRARIQWYASATGLLKQDVDGKAWRKDTISAMAFGVLFVLSAGLAFISPIVAYASWFVVLGGWAVLSRSGIFGLLVDRFRRD